MSENTRRFQSCLISPVVRGKGVAKPALHVQPKSLSEENTQVTNTSSLRFVLTQPCYVLMRFGAANESLTSPRAELCAQLLSFCSLWKKIPPLTKHCHQNDDALLYLLFVCVCVCGWNAQNEFLSSNEVFVAMLTLHEILALFCLKEIGYEYESGSNVKLCCLFQRFFFWRKKEVTVKCCHSNSEDNFYVPPVSW